MSEDQTPVPSQEPVLLPPHQPTLLERFGFSPVVFAFLSLFLVSVIYVFGGIVFALFFGATPTAANVYIFRLTAMFSEIAFFLVPALILVWAITHTPSDFFRLRRPGVLQIVLPLIGVICLQVMSQIYMVYQSRIPLPQGLEDFIDQYKQLYDQATLLIAGSGSVKELIWVIVVIGVTPAIAEEFLFRGLIQRSLQRAIPPLNAAVITGILFGVFHLNPSSLIPLVAIGVYLGYLAYCADSIWVSVIAHFFYNTVVAVVLYFRFDDDYVVTGNAEQMSNGMLLFTFWLFGLIFILSTLYFARISRRRDIAPEPHEDDQDHPV
ncbi:MAG TPA: type II CAAX endopeptidase family protein [Bacteroidota bacterium]|nr:type II CAAX endopeptidase family protein [Bacteroidota bacterium]